MSPEQQTVLLIKGAIADLPPAQNEACLELVDHLKRAIKMADPVVGTLALALVGAEAQLSA